MMMMMMMIFNSSTNNYFSRIALQYNRTCAYCYLQKARKRKTKLKKVTSMSLNSEPLRIKLAPISLPVKH